MESDAAPLYQGLGRTLYIQLCNIYWVIAQLTGDYYHALALNHLGKVSTDDTKISHSEKHTFDQESLKVHVY